MPTPAEITKRFGTNLEYFRNLAGYTQDSLAKAVKVAKDEIQNAESGQTQLRLQYVMQCAKTLGITMHDLYARDITPKGIATVYRKDDIDIRSHLPYIAGLRQLVETMEAVGSFPMPEVALPSVEPLTRNAIVDGKANARHLRLQLGLDGPIEDLVALCKNLGYPVIFANFPEGVSGCTFTVANRAAILINRNEASNRQRFTIAHELGHIFMDVIDTTQVTYRSDIVGGTNKGTPEERRANVFAIHFLAPLNRCDSHSPNTWTIERFARTYGISDEAARFHLKNERYLDGDRVLAAPNPAPQGKVRISVNAMEPESWLFAKAPHLIKEGKISTQKIRQLKENLEFA